MTTTFTGHVLTGTHAARPAASAVPEGALYSCTTHSLVYQSNLTAWSTWATLSGLADQGSFTYLDATEAAAPGTPSSGKARIYAKTDGRIYSKDDAGVEYGPFSSGGGGGSGYVAAITAEADIVQYWPLNEASGATSFNDVIGGTDLTTVGSAAAGGPTLTKDYGVGGSVTTQFSTNDISRSAITWGAAWSIEVWLCLPGSFAGDAWMFGQWDGSGAMVFANATDVFIFKDGTSASWAGGTAATRGVHHWVMTHDGTTQRLWVDGVNRVSQTIAIPGTNVGGDFGIGLDGGVGWAGTASDLALYDVALSSTKINDHYTLGTS